MAHFAKIGLDNKVIGLFYLRNIENIDPITGLEDEKYGSEYLTKNHGHELWIQYSNHTHCNTHSRGRTPLRYNAPQIGWTYDSKRDAFIPPDSLKPAPSWIWDDDICWWKCPVEKPSEDDFTDEERNGILNEDGSWKVRPSFWEWRESENKWVKTNDEFDYNYNK